MKTSPGILLLAVLILIPAAVFAQPFGLTNRVAATNLRMPPMLPGFGYTNANAFGSMTFIAPVAIVSPPGETNRLFIVEQMGRIIVITNLASPTSTVFMDISGRVNFNGEQGLLGLAFHPGYLTNRFFFVFYVTTGARRDQLSRFEFSMSDPNQGLTNSEVVLISQPDDFDNHNAGDLHFGPDGYLYVSLGDEGGANDTGANSQRIDKDFFSAIMRLDVDKRPGSLAPTPHSASSTNYAIPSDNPFIGATEFNGIPVTGNVRTEFWAVGLRNPWRFSFDDVTGLLYCGDVGQNTREEVDIIVKGGNYGWNYREGYIQRPGSGAPPAGFSSIPPILDYPRTPAGATNVGTSVTGGVVYRGNRIPQLNGFYIFGDYGSGNIWALRYDGSVTTNVPFTRLIGDAGVSAFGIDPSNGDVLYADVGAGVVRRLIYGAVVGPALPATLAGTGAFTNLITLAPSPGVIPYEVNVAAWSDQAISSRWFAITNPLAKITFRSLNNWTFPASSLWIQHFELELTNGVPGSRRRLETRFLVRDNGSGAYGVTYRWDSQTNASLVGDAGLDEAFLINDGGNLRTQIWHYPSRAECLACHTGPTIGGLAIGFNTPQLNRDFNYGGVTDNQIRSLNNVGYFSTPVTNQHSLRALAAGDDEGVSLEQRARSYLAANCAQCHLPFGTSRSFDARIYQPLSVVNLVNGALTNSFGNPASRVVVPGSLTNSMLLTRLSILDSNRMPPIGSSLLDAQAIGLLSRWITNELPNYQSLVDWQLAFFGSTNAPNALATADPDTDGANNQLEWLTSTSPLLMANVWGDVSLERSGDTALVTFPQIARRGFEVQWTTNLLNSSSWQFLNVSNNRPFFAVSNFQASVPDLITNAPGIPAKYYRVRVYEP